MLLNCWIFSDRLNEFVPRFRYDIQHVMGFDGRRRSDNEAVAIRAFAPAIRAFSVPLPRAAFLMSGVSAPILNTSAIPKA